MELELFGRVQLEQSGAELALEHFGDGLHRKEPASLLGADPGVLRGEPAAGDQAMEVGMVHEVLAPSVKDGGNAQLRAEALLAKLE